MEIVRFTDDIQPKAKLPVHLSQDFTLDSNTKPEAEQSSHYANRKINKNRATPSESHRGSPYAMNFSENYSRKSELSQVSAIKRKLEL